MKQIPGYPLFFAGEDGRIYKQKGKYKRQLTQFIAPYGKYFYVYLTTGRCEKKLMAVHKLIASAFTEINYNEIEVEHIDGNIYNNKPDNLKTSKKNSGENVKDERRINIINIYENILRDKIQYNYESDLWQQYRKIKETGNSRKIYNWLYVNLR